MIDGNRQTGRTFLMMKEVIKQVKDGKRCVVVSTNHHQGKILQSMYKNMGGPDKDILFISGPKWGQALKGFSSEVLLFRDHYDVEYSEEKLLFENAKLKSENEHYKRKLEEIEKIIQNANLGMYNDYYH